MAQVVPLKSPPPIAALPPELLADIFVRCVPVSPRRVQTDVRWLAITQVSKLWRSVALACPDLWSTIVLSRPTWIPLFLARSKMAPLVIRADLSKGYLPIEPLLVGHSSQLGILDIRSPPWALDGLFPPMDGASSAPRLHDLKIVNTYPFLPYGDIGIWLPTNLFGRREVLEDRKVGVGPGLQLHLAGCAFPWDSAWYSHLTHLHLEAIPACISPTMETLLSALSGSPNLESLTLLNCNPTTSRGDCVVFPRLSSLIYKTERYTCSSLLSRLAIPLSAVLYASCSLTTHKQRVSLDCNPVWDYYHPLWDCYPSTYDTVRIINAKGVTYTLCDTARPWWRRKFRAYSESSSHNILWAVDSVAAHLDLSCVTTLHLHGTVPHVDGADTVVNMWRVLGRGMPCVRALHLYDAFPSGWLEFMLTQAMYVLGLTHFRYALYGLKWRDSPDAPPSHAWPALLRLGLHAMDLGEFAGNPTWAARPSELLAALLWARREGGARICELEIDEDCANVSPQALWRFRLFADVFYNKQSEMGMAGVEGDVREECPRAYSLGVLEHMIQREENMPIWSPPSPVAPSTADAVETTEMDS